MPFAYKRAVLGLHYRTLDPATLAFAGEFAGLLRLELHGLFVADEALLEFARLPFAREFRRLGGAWQAIDPARLATEFDAAVREAERTFGELRRRLSVGCTFEVVRGGAARAMAAVSARDIMIVPEPASPVERVVQPFAHLMEAAFRSQAAVLLVPPRIARRTGPVVALAASANDPAIANALAVAAASGEGVVIAAPRPVAEDPAVAAQARNAGVSVTPLVLPALSIPARTLAERLGPARERLIVVTRGAFAPAREEDLSALAALRRVPVLVVEPAGE